MQEGYGEFQVCQERGVRADAYRQYLKPVENRQNLTVLTQARTLGIEFENSRGQQVAKGVKFQTEGPDGERHTGLESFQLKLIIPSLWIQKFSHVIHVFLPSSEGFMCLLVLGQMHFFKIMARLV